MSRTANTVSAVKLLPSWHMLLALLLHTMSSCQQLLLSLLLLSAYAAAAIQLLQLLSLLLISSSPSHTLLLMLLQRPPMKVQLPNWQRLPLLLSALRVSRLLMPLLLLLSPASVNAGPQHAFMKGDVLMLLLLSMQLPCCFTAADAGVGSWSSISGESADGLVAVSLRPMQDLLLVLPDAGSACGASASDDADALPLLAGMILPHRPRKPPCPAEDQRLLPASEGLGEPAGIESRLACRTITDRCTADGNMSLVPSFLSAATGILLLLLLWWLQLKRAVLYQDRHKTVLDDMWCWFQMLAELWLARCA